MANYELDYYENNMSLTEIAKKYNVSYNSVRKYLLDNGYTLRSRHDGVRLSFKKHGSPHKGKKRKPMTEATKIKISNARTAWADKNAKGVSLKPSGYLEFTRGDNKGRSVHLVEAEKKIGRKLYKDEVVHHIDHNKTNNNHDNLQVMTKNDHARYHGKYNLKIRKRNKDGKFTE